MDTVCSSLREFVQDSGDYALKMVDSLLDILTQGDHTTTTAFCQEREREREQEQERKRHEAKMEVTSSKHHQ